ncbi:MAG: SUMF1/EgtB/PvdO family nonheme iron enzyme [Nitrospira sp.]|nr:SUMF1/EgtB/PvdO family nonheme iron enzyme [Nitrospira sp.]MDH5348203.1 SUMF1/EgtB/PvdO family nonheme iron enzyme [Nitrospira sp.]MDH5498147.1 SUMF1/EgtB/PvdO family nonheme iron enzyme [Nitrospira sp.]MDH5724427.1 SUMF1/EgtB/PvdO family nonheme iron enzyme [Nitrospira sp.]
MVSVPGGTFWMGISDDEADRVNEDCKTEVKKQAASCTGWVLSAQPRHQVTLDPFSLDPYEVTNRQFDQFVQATGYLTTAEIGGHGLRLEQ